MERKTVGIDVIYIDEPASEQSLKGSFAKKKSLYGLDQETYMALAKAQGYSCASCKASAKGMEHKLCVDHDHETNEIRGLLCQGCNTALGWLEDDPKKIVFRTYMRCLHCQKWGKLVFFEKGSDRVK